MCWRLLTFLCALSISACVAASGEREAAQATTGATPDIERGASVEGITEFRLANGLRVLLIPDSSQGTTLVNVVYLVGSRHESRGATGAAHLLEHMMFKGSPKHPNIPQEVAARGASANASTSYDSTSYFTTFAADEHTLSWVLDLEADRMVSSFLAQKDLDSEMTVVRNEFERNENSPLRVLKQRVRSAAYLWHNYGNALIGARSDIEQIPIERLRSFYRTYYQPDNAVVIVAGRFDEAATLEQIQKLFGAIPRPTRALPETYTTEPTQDGQREVVLRRTGEGGATIVGYHVPAGSHPDFAAVSILGRILADVPAGRLHQALVATGKATSILRGSLNPPLHDPFMLSMIAEVRAAANLESVRDTLVGVIEAAADALPASSEFERARGQLLNNVELTLRSPLRTARALGGWAAAGDWRLLFLYRDRLREAGPADVQRVAAAYLKPSNRTIGLFIPEAAPQRAEIPPAPDVAAQVRGYAGDPTYTAGEVFEPTIANIEQRTTRSGAGGLKLALLPKRTRAHTVTGHLVLHFGNEHNLRGQAIVGEIAGGLLMRGTATRSRQAIQSELDQRLSTAQVLGDADSASAQFDTTRQHLPATLKLVADMLRRPSFPADEFSQLLQSRLAALEHERSEPLVLANRVLKRRMQPYSEGDPRYIMTLDEEIAAVKAVSLEDVRQFHARFYGASHAELALVGDFDPADATALVQELFGDWPSRVTHAPLRCAYQPVPASTHVLRIPDKASAVFLAAQNLDVRATAPEWPALLIAGEMLGGGFMNSRLAERLRQTDGLSYSVAASFSAGSTRRCGEFRASAIAAPQNMPRLQVAFNEEIARALRDGFTPTELAAATTGWLRQQRLARAHDSALASRLVFHLALGRTLEWDAAIENRVRDLNVEQVNAALRKYLHPAQLTIVQAGDFAAQDVARTTTR